MKITRRKDYLYIKTKKANNKFNFKDMRIALEGVKKSICYGSQLVVHTQYIEYRYNVSTPFDARNYRDLINKFISEWQAKQNVV